MLPSQFEVTFPNGLILLKLNKTYVESKIVTRTRANIHQSNRFYSSQNFFRNHDFVSSISSRQD
jgi:hypothetical protein